MKIDNHHWTRIVQERDATLMPFHLFAKSIASEIKEVMGKNLSPILIYFHPKGAEFYVDKENMGEVGKLAYSHNLDLNKYERSLINLDEELESLVSLSRKIISNLNKINENQVINYIERLAKGICLVNKWNQYSALSEYGENNFISGDLGDLIISRLEERKIKANFLKLLTLLVSPVRDTFLHQQKVDLLRIALLAKNDPQGILSEKVKKEILKHQSKFLWLEFGYVGPAHDFAYYQSELTKLIEQNNIEEEYINKKTELKELALKQEEYEELLGLSDMEKRRFFLARDLGFYKVYRKEITYLAMYVIDELNKKLAEFWEVDYKLFRFILPKECDKEHLQSLYQQRKEECIYFINEGEEEVFSGKQISEIMKEVKKEESPSTETSKKQYTGRPAYVHKDKVRGRVKIVNGANHVSKVETGDILVSFATNPQMIVAMGKAAAIVTEQGGITCHAAIVAREMKKPCLVGVNKITQHLNDGDLVEVDTLNGFLNILDEDDPA